MSMTRQTNDGSSMLLAIVVILGFFYMYYLAIFRRKPVPIVFCSIFTPVIVAAYSGNVALIGASVILGLVLGVYYMVRSVLRGKKSHFALSLFFVSFVLLAYGGGGLVVAQTLLIILTLFAMMWYGADAMWKWIRLGYRDLTSG